MNSVLPIQNRLKSVGTHHLLRHTNPLQWVLPGVAPNSFGAAAHEHTRRRPRPDDLRACGVQYEQVMSHDTSHGMTGATGGRSGHAFCPYHSCMAGVPDAAVAVSLMPRTVLRLPPRSKQPPRAYPFMASKGILKLLPGSTFGEVFVAADGTRLTAVGANATVAQQIDVLARQSPPAAVKVWGTRNFAPKPDYVSDLVVSEILPEGDVAQPPPQPTQAASGRHPGSAGGGGRGQLQPGQSLQYAQPVHVGRRPGARRRALQSCRAAMGPVPGCW